MALNSAILCDCLHDTQRHWAEKADRILTRLIRKESNTRTHALHTRARGRRSFGALNVVSGLADLRSWFPILIVLRRSSVW